VDESFKPESITSIAKGTQVIADIQTKSDMHIAGMVDGDIKAKRKLVLTESGRLTGSVIAQEAVISGRFTGELRVLGQIIVTDTAVVDGFIFSKLITVEAGAEVVGIMSIGEHVDVLNAKISKQPKNPEVKKVIEKASKVVQKSPQNGKPSPLPNKTPKPAPNRHTCNVLIGIPQSNIKPEIAAKIREACENLMTNLGFKLEIFDEPDFSPFFQKLTYVRKSEESKEELKTWFEKGKKSLETALLNKGKTDAAGSLQSASDHLIQLLKVFDEYVLILGDVALTQLIEDDVQTIACELVSDKLSQQLKSKPELVANPSHIYQFLDH
jgi:cytoskeletal protein CcmA (bactofilin family)